MKNWLQKYFTPKPETLARRLGLSGANDLTHWCMAAPVHFEARLDFLSLTADLRAALSPTEAEALRTHINAHFAADGLQLFQPKPGLWLLQIPEPLPCPQADPAAAQGGDIARHLPKTAIKAASIINEIQMLLHEHQVNHERESRGQLAANGFWLWRY